MTKKRFKRIYTCLIVLTIVSSAFFGCGNTTTAASGSDQNADTQEVQENVADEPGSVETGTEQTQTAETPESESSEAVDNGSAEKIEGLTAEFQPNPEYDKYTLVDYEVEDIAAQFIATVSAKEDGSEYEIHCSLDGEEQIVVLDKDLNIISDKTGAMSYDAPLIVQRAVDANNWISIN